MFRPQTVNQRLLRWDGAIPPWLSTAAALAAMPYHLFWSLDPLNNVGDTLAVVVALPFRGAEGAALVAALGPSDEVQIRVVGHNEPVLFAFVPTASSAVSEPARSRAP